MSDSSNTGTKLPKPPTGIGGVKFADIKKTFDGLKSAYTFIKGIFDSDTGPTFQTLLLEELQKIESELIAIKQDLDKIYEELKKIDKSIQGLDLNPKLTAIQSWGEALAALDPNDARGRVNLANEMWTGKFGSPSLPNSMDGIYNATIGVQIGGDALVDLLSIEGTLRIRARLLQGMHLLAFVCAFNDKEKLNFGVFLWQWSGKFRTLTQLMLKQKNKVHITESMAWAGLPLLVTDTITLYDALQSELDGVGVYVKTDKEDNLLLGSGKLTMGKPAAGSYDPVREPMEKHVFLAKQPMVPQDKRGLLGSCAFVNLKTGEMSLDPNSKIANEFTPDPPFDRFLRVTLSLGPYGEPANTFSKRGKLSAAARTIPSQTFLGAAGGQLAWVEDGKPYIGCLFDGRTTAGDLILFDPQTSKLTSASVDGLDESFDITNALWRVTWAGVKNRVEISPYRTDIAQIRSRADTKQEPLALTVNADGDWTLSPKGTSDSSVAIAVPFQTPERMDNPLEMTPSYATISKGGKGRDGLFYAL